MIDFGTLPLTVRAVITVVTVNGSAFVEMDPIMLQRFDQHFYGAGNLPLGIGILHPKKQNAAALMGHPLRGQPLNQITKVNKTGGGRGHTGDDGSLGNISRGVFRFHLLRCRGNLGEEQLGQCAIIHGNYLFTNDMH